MRTPTHRPRRHTRLPITAPPEPDTTLVHNTTTAAGVVTAIARTWPEGHGHTFCRLCPVGHCSLTERMCLVVVPALVADPDAPAFSLSLFFGGPALAPDDAGAGHGLRVYRGDGDGAGGVTGGHEPG